VESLFDPLYLILEDLLTREALVDGDLHLLLQSIECELYRLLTRFFAEDDPDRMMLVIFSLVLIQIGYVLVHLSDILCLESGSLELEYDQTLELPVIEEEVDAMLLAIYDAWILLSDEGYLSFAPLEEKECEIVQYSSLEVSLEEYLISIDEVEHILISEIV
jgi:hypothetical protein